MSGELDVRRPVEEISSGWNRSVRSRVIQDVGKTRAGRGLFAAMVAVGVVLAGCGPGDNGGSTTTTPVAEGPVNPWELPLEERPPLFDPCEEVPTGLIEGAVGSPMEPNPNLHNDEPDELKSCGWSNYEVMVTVLSTWKSFDNYMDDGELVVVESDHRAFGRPSLQMSTAESGGERRCHTLFFTGHGTVMINLSLGTATREFEGDLLSEACEVLDRVGQPVVDRIPKGDFR